MSLHLEQAEHRLRLILRDAFDNTQKGCFEGDPLRNFIKALQDSANRIALITEEELIRLPDLPEDFPWWLPE